MEPKILYEDSHILVIDKPAGFVSNKADTTIYQKTVQEWAEKHFKDQKIFLNPNSDSEFERRGGVVHRLDKETSGVLILAKDEESFVNLQKQFKEKKVRKTYIALCHGEIKPTEGEINVPIGRLPWNRTRFGVYPEAREATTKYKVIKDYQLAVDKNLETLSLVEVYPQTGRTHQIRVHMQYIKHPIFADELYAGRKVSKRDRKLLSRHFLHANKIKFTHPITGSNMEFESSLPQDLSDFLQVIK